MKTNYFAPKQQTPANNVEPKVVQGTGQVQTKLASGQGATPVKSYVPQQQQSSSQKGAYAKNVVQMPNSGKLRAGLLKNLKVPGKMSASSDPKNRQSIAITRISNNCKNADQMKTSKQLREDQKLKLICKVQARIRGTKQRRQYLVMLKNYKYRRNVILELIKTERDYVADLELIVTKIFLPLALDKIITDDQLKTFQSSLTMIKELNQQFLQELTQRFDKEGPFKQIQGVGPYQCFGDILNHFSKFFKMYFTYYDEFTKMDALSQQLKQQNPKFAAFNRKMSESKEFRFLDFDSFIVKPIQRLPKYVLLLKDLLKHTDPTHPDYQGLEKATADYSEVTESNNCNLDSFLKGSKLQDIGKQFPELKIVVPNRSYISEEQINIFWKNKVKNAVAHLMTDLVIVASRNADDGKLKLIAEIKLNEDSIVKALPDTENFVNLLTLVGENKSITFLEASVDQRQKRLEQFEAILTELRVRAEQKMETLLKKNQKVEKKSHPIEVQVIGTESRPGMFKTIIVYVIEISISNISQKVYLRHKEIVDVQDLVKSLYPTLAVDYVKVSLFSSGSTSKEIDSRTINIISFFSTLLQSNEFRTSTNNKVVLAKMGLPENFYQLPDMLDQENSTNLYATKRGSHANLDFRSSTSSSNLNLVSSEEPSPADVRIQRRLDGMQQDNKRSQNPSMGKKFSASKLIRSVGNSVEKGFSPDRDKKEKFKKENFVNVTIYTHHPQKPKIQVQLNEQSITQDVQDIVFSDLGIQEMFDFRFLVPQNDKNKQWRVLGDDENLHQIFAPSNFLDKILSQQKEIHFKKYVYLEKEQEELQYINDSLKLEMVFTQCVADLGNYMFNFKEYCFLAACYFYINGIFSNKFPFEKLAEIVPSSILKNTKKDLWAQFIPDMYKQLVGNVATGVKDLKMAPVQIAKMVFISNLFTNPLFGKQLFAVQATKETQTLLGCTDPSIFVAVSIQGLSIFDSKKKTQLKIIAYDSLVQIKCFPTSLLIEDENKYTFNCNYGYQIQQLIDEYIQIDLVMKSGDVQVEEFDDQ